MAIDANLFDIIVLMGALHGFISSVVLYRNKKNSRSNKILSAIVFLISLACINIFLLEGVDLKETYIVHLLQVSVPLVIIMPLGPLIYFYLKSILDPKFEISQNTRVHFLSIIVDLFPYLLSLFFEIAILFGIEILSSSTDFYHFIDTYEKYVDIPRFISLVVYLIYAFRLLNRDGMNFKTIKLEWPAQLVVSFSIFSLIWFVHLIFYIHPETTQVLLSSLGWYPIYIPLVVLVYWLGYKGYRKSNVDLLVKRNPIQFSDKIIKETVQSLHQIMNEERLYLNPSLGLKDVMDTIGLPQKTISAVLNQHLGKTFNEFINEYRVTEVKSKLEDEAYQHLTLTGVAFECGFNSQSTFQRAFKNVTGMTPSFYQKRLLKQEEINSQI